MNKLSRTRLDLLMNVTEVTGKLLATSLHLDMSMISRWKNGKRAIRSQAYLEELAAFFVHFEKGKLVGIIQQLVQRPCEGLELEGALADWLSKPLIPEDNPKYYMRDAFKSDQINKNTLSCDYLSFLGNEGRREAVLHLLHLLSNMEKPRKLLLYSNEDMDWLTEDKEFLKQWTTHLTNILSKGHEIHIIHHIERSPEALLTAMVQWVPLYLAGKVMAYKIHETEAGMQWSTLFIIQDLCGVSGYCVNHKSNDRYTLFTNDVVTLQSLMSVFRHLVSKSTRLCKAIKAHQLPLALKTITDIGLRKDGSFFKSEELFFTTMPRGLLIEVLESNRLSKEKVDKVVGFYDRLTQNFGNNVKVFKNHHLYDLEALRERAEKPYELSRHLTHVCGQEIRIDAASYAGQLESIISRLKSNDNYQVGLYMGDRSHIPLEDVNVWIKDGFFASFWDYRHSEQMVISMEPTMVDAFIRFYNATWDLIPYLYKEKEYVIKQLEKLLLVIAANGSKI